MDNTDHIRETCTPIQFVTDREVGLRMHSQVIDLAGHMRPVDVGFLQINGKELVAVLDESTQREDGKWVTTVWRGKEQ